MLTDHSPIVRHECAFSLEETDHPTLAGPYLMKVAETDKNIFVVHKALLALGTSGKREFIHFIENFLNDSKPEIAESAVAIENIKYT